MKKLMAVLCVAVISTVAAGVSHALAASQTQTAPAAGMGLEGTRWKVSVTPDAAAAAKGEKTFEDEVIIAEGKVTMTACVPYGFMASPYKSSKNGDGWSFKTTQKSEKEGETQWKLEMKGYMVTGSLTSTKKDGTVFHYEVVGKKSGS